MDDLLLLTVLSISHLLQLAAGVFFHEPSSVLFNPSKPLEHSDFGFSMGYRAGINNLVIGAPSVDNVGKVYTCELDDVSYKNKITCDENQIDISTEPKFSRDINPNQYFYTGSSIAVTSDFFFTCAPLWTSVISNPKMSDAFGACFLQNDTDTYRYHDTLKRYSEQPWLTDEDTSLIGGTGWSTLADEENDLLLVVKTSLTGDFIYTPLSKPWMESKSMMIDGESAYSRNLLLKHWNVGFGITAGKFFSNSTVYAFSMETPNMEGAISFLQYSNLKLTLVSRSKVPVSLKSRAINTMFGSALGAADLNLDERDELLVGAPAYSEDDYVECGALHIYLGGEMETIEERKRLRTILGDKAFTRFGSAIAVKDIDGDSIPELAVSAPYEDGGLGAVYILSGYELYHSIIKHQTYKRIHLSDLRLRQRIQKQDFTTLGFSLQFVHDTDDNGCSELVMGSPNNATVLLFKCLQTINVTMTSKLIGEQIVKEQHNNFTVEVCARVKIHKLPSTIMGSLSVTTSIIGEATYIRDPKFSFDISCFECDLIDRNFCHNVTVFLNDNEPGDYKFTSRAVLPTDHIFKSKEFNTSWVVASPHSRMVNNLEVPRHCSGDDCKPKLILDVFCIGKTDYVLGSSSNQTVNIQVRNDGHASYDACLQVRVSGAPLSLGINCTDENGVYKCYLPKPLRRNAEHSMNITLDMTKPTNLEEELLVEAVLYENCNQRSVFSKDRCQISYEFDTNNIFVNGISHDWNVTDNQLMVSDAIFDDQEFLITNNGSITWKNILAIISMEKKQYNHSFAVTEIESRKCEEDRSTDNLLAYQCILDLAANSTQKITVTNILGKDMKDHLYDGKLNMTAELQLFLRPTEEMLATNATTVLYFEEELTFANNKLLIAILALLLAIIILAILIFVLYKYGFFRRKQKQRLHVLRESIKRQNSRRPTHASEPKDENAEGLQMEYDADSPFDDIPTPMSTHEHTVLVEERAQVHC